MARRWTEDELDKMLSMQKSGESFSAIGQAFGCAGSTAKSALQRFKKKKTKAPRKAREPVSFLVPEAPAAADNVAILVVPVAKLKAALEALWQ